MAAPIPPSLSQLINPQAAPARPAPKPEQGGGFATALQAQKAFFQQVTQPKITPATYTAADIARAAQAPTQSPAVAAPAPTQDTTQPYKRPGSYLNIVI